MRGPRTLDQLGESHARVFGAKAANLGRMASGGLPVPAGFAVAFDEGSALDEGGRGAIAAAYARLGQDVPVAVRSSAVGEDSEAASFAGQHETFLGVVGARAVVDAVERCLASLRSERAEAYRAHAGLDAGGMGVVVQTMVEAEHAGVCFTRSPGEEDEVVVEVVRGLGESLVRGRERPARVSMRRTDLESVSRDDHEGILEAFGDGRAARVARLALGAEETFGFALDVEWAWAGGRFHLLQARPITAGGVESERDEIRRQEMERLASIAGRRTTVWSDFSIGDMLQAASPLCMDLFRRFVRHDGGVGRSFRRIGFLYSRSPSTRHIFDRICSRPFLNITEFVRAANADLPLTVDPGVLTSGDPFDPAAPPVRIDWRSVGKILLLPLSLLRWILVVPYRFFTLRRRYHGEFTRVIGPSLREEAATLRTQDLSGLSLDDLWDLFGSYADRITTELIYYHQLSDIFAFTTHRLFVRNLRILYGDGAAGMEVGLTTGLEGNFNTESNLALADVAAGRTTMGDFLEDYGYRGNPDWDVRAPRWREDPGRVEAMAGIIARSGADPRARFEEQKAVRKGAEEKLHHDLGKHWILRPWRGSIMKELRHYQRYSPLREETQGCCYLWVELARMVLLEAGRRTGAGDLVFDMGMDDLRAFLVRGASADLLDGARAARRRAGISRGIHVPHVVRSDELGAIGRLPPVDLSSRELRGHVASTGVVQGRARVVHGLDEARSLERGEILVACFTDPAWTPLFLVAGGLVLEQGGMLSHGAIVAREYGLPAVINVADATRQIETGQEIVLDADTGRVLLDAGQ